MTNKEAYQLITILHGLKSSSGTKLEHAKTQTLKKASKFIEVYNDRLEDLNIEYCSTDEKGNILRDSAGQYLFTKDNQRKLCKELKQFMESDQIASFEIVSTSDKNGLSDSVAEYLTEIGFIREALEVM